jgi:hypothetical protein
VIVEFALGDASTFKALIHWSSIISRSERMKNEASPEGQSKSTGTIIAPLGMGLACVSTGCIVSINVHCGLWIRDSLASYLGDTFP